jgi:CelD/BcsL family acetyltransferase involved in cellulose biosynthesis
MGSLSVEEVHDSSALPRHADEWRALAERASEGGLFLTWEWVAAWLEHFRGKRPLVVLLVREGTRLVGVLPLLEERMGFWGSGRRLVGAANNQSPRAGVLCEGETEPVLRALLEHLSSTRRSIRLVLPVHEAQSPLAAALKVAAPGFGLLTRFSRRSPVVRIEQGWDAYVKTRSKQTRRAWQRKRRHLEQGGPLRYRVVTDPKDAAPAMADVFEIERHSWKEDTGTSFTADPALEPFYRDLALGFAARGWLRLHLLYVNEAPVAHVFAARYRGELLAIKASYDQRSHQLSPGINLMLRLIEQAFAEGAEAVDLLGEEARWKAEMANELRICEDSFVFTRGLPDGEARFLLETWLKPVLRRRAPWLFDLKRRLVDGSRAPLGKRQTQAPEGSD